jgi:hypothetical protein
MTYTGFKTFTTRDGAWEYGYGEYNKKLTDAAGVSTYQVSSEVYKNLPSPLDSLYKAFLQPAVATAIAVREPAIVPTYYIWAKAIGKDAARRVAGEWYFDRTKRDSYFDQFVSSFDPSNTSLSDAMRVVVISQFAAMKSSSYSITGLASAAKAAGISAVTKADDYPPSSAGSSSKAAPYVVLTVVGLALIVYLLKH